MKNIREIIRINKLWNSQKLDRLHGTRNASSRRNTKNKAKGIGQWLKKSRVREDVPIERVFPAFKF